MQNRSSPDYFTAYHNLKLTRDADGVLVAEFHSNGEPFIMTAQAHAECLLPDWARSSEQDRNPDRRGRPVY
jgi:hypothetical protein